MLRIADGPDEVHRNQIARLELREYDNNESTRGANAYVPLLDEDGADPLGPPRWVV